MRIEIDEYTFIFRSRGVIVLRGEEYVDFFDTFEDALEFTGKSI